VLDEPPTGVDPVCRAELSRPIARAAAASTAVVLATAYLDKAERAGTLPISKLTSANATLPPNALPRP
jgi:ABC-type multidrug transport system ATPase subunit